MPGSIGRLLVANRGEIARRVFRTAHAMGISSVAVYSDADRRSLHVDEADTAVALGGTSSAESYLDIDKVVDAARRTGADAVHPGYGFLAENADFATAVIDAGLVWVGPSPEAIAAMARKVEAKRLVGDAGVPLLPGVTVDGDDPRAWLAAADRVGYPLLVKASAGGGGKGMRPVDRADELADAVAAARREAASSFGDPTVFVERLLDRPRHVEVQVFGDHHGNLIHLHTRDCSVQRRHQKVVEEAPAPGLSAGLRERLHDAAVAAAKAIGYANAGTVEFLVTADEPLSPDHPPPADARGAGGEFFFLEMNTRLQVEHPVTDAVCGVDLVEWQLRVAAGEPLPSTEPLEARGHAIEARLYAEDPAHDFLPSVGTVWRFEPGGAGDVADVRWDSGVATGSEVSSYYDPLLAKAIATAPTRTEAAAKLARGLRRLHVHGVTTNRDSLVAVLEHEAFVAGDVDTGFFDDHPTVLAPSPPADVQRFHAIAAALALRAQRAAASPLPRVARAGWRNVPSGPAHQRFTVGSSGDAGAHEVDVAYGPPPRFGASMPVWVDGDPLVVDGVDVSTDHVDVEIDRRRRRAEVHTVGDRHWVNGEGWQTELVEVPRFPASDAEMSGHGPTAPVPGTVTAVEVVVGDRVTAGQALVVLEAMKMEHRLTAERDGVVAEVRVAAGDQVDAHQLLVVIAPDDEAAGS